MKLMWNKKKLWMMAAGLATAASLSAQYDSLPRVTPFTGTRDYRTWSIGVYGGGSAAFSPFGNNDFKNYDFHNLGFLYGAYIKKQIFHAFGLQLDFMRGQVKGSEKNSQPLYYYNDNSNNIVAVPLQKFKTHINWSASLSGVFTLGTINWLNKQATVIPYISAGGGVMAFWSETGNKNDDYSSYIDGNGKYYIVKPPNTRKFFIPVGVGAKFNVARGVNIDLLYKVNFVNSQYFDGVAASGHNDKFSSVNLGVEFALGKKSKPQLAVINPAAQLAMDLWDRNQYLKEQLQESDARNAAAVQDLQQKIDDLSKDSDGDGVPDVHDKCPNTASGIRVDGAGCPLPQPKQVIEKEKVVVTQEDRKVVDEAIKDLQFDVDKATIRPESFSSLDQVAQLLINKNFSLKLAGNTDNTGNKEHNMILSKQRAEAVKQYLVSKGANPSRIEAVGYGDTQPIASNDTPEGRQQNRRVEFTLY